MSKETDLETAPSYYVGVGASAGGLEAIETFFTNMAPDSGFSFIVVQHLSPDYKSLMVELLSKKTEMPVFRAEDGVVVQRDAVYLIPPKKNLTIFHGKLILSEQDASRGINLPIDVFLRSLAEDQGEKAIAIILSGTGSDGTRGIRSIKELGGMIMVQNEDSARFDGMPRAAISTGLADFVLPPHEMPKQLLAFSKHPYNKPKPGKEDGLIADGDAITRIFSILRDKAKVDFTYYKPNTVTRRIERRMTINQITDIREYADYLTSFPGEVMSLYRELLIGVTNFFRDPEAFEDLERKWLPELLKNAEKQEVRFWVAGCSTGEEAYTLAILAREVMDELDISRDIKIFATDIDRDAIQYAGAGIYPESIAADISPRIFAKYFYKKEDRLQIARNIREMIVFAQHNLIKDPPFTNIDLLSCRNLLIYLQPILQRKVMDFFNFSLKPKGILVLGTSETTGEMSDYFETLNQKYKIYRSKGKLKQVIQPNLYAGSSFTGGRGRTGDGQLAAGGGRQTFRAQEEERLLDRFLGSIVGDYVPLSVIVNDSLEVLHIVGDTEGFFKLPSGRVVNDISKMATKDLSIPLATGIQKVFRSGQNLVYSNVHLSSMSSSKVINLKIKLLPQKKGQEPLAAVFITEASRESVKTDSPETATYDLSREAEQHIKDLEQELQFTRENLQATIEELETANEELQATNEELLASNEELQSTNEELQSTNEELHTVNSEYQNKIIELTELNNDLDNLLANTQIGILILDENMEIRRFSPQISRIFKILGNDVGRPITHLSHFMVNFDPVTVIEKVQKTGLQTDYEVQTTDNRWYLMRILPYHITPKTFAGTVVSFIDITTVLETTKALKESEAKLKGTAKLAKIGYWEYDVALDKQIWSTETFDIHELPQDRQPPPEEGINYYAPEHRQTITEVFTKACKDGTPYDLVLEILTAKGNRRWVRAIGNPEKNNGKVSKVWGVFQDITETRALVDALAESRQRIVSVLDVSPIGIGFLKDRVLLQVNKRLCEMTGYSEEELIGKNSRMLYLTQEDYDIAGKEKYGKIKESGVGTVETLWKKKDGKVIEILLSFAPIVKGKPEDGVSFTALDITDRKE